MHCDTPGFFVHHYLPVCWNSCPLSQWCHPTILSRHSLLLLPSIFPSIRISSSKSVLCIRWPKYWSFSLSMSPSNKYSGLISFRIDWFDLLVVQGSSPAPQFESVSSLVLSLLWLIEQFINQDTTMTQSKIDLNYVSNILLSFKKYFNSHHLHKALSPCSQWQNRVNWRINEKRRSNDLGKIGWCLNLEAKAEEPWQPS